MTLRPDGLTDYEDLTPPQKAQAEAFISSFSTRSKEDAPLFAFRVTKGSQGVPAGIVSTSRKDKAPSRFAEESSRLFDLGRPIL